MARRVFSAFLLVIMSITLCGCVAVLAGAGGTALWQAGKIISEENVSMIEAVSATEKVFETRKIALTEKVAKSGVTQLRGTDQTDKKVAVDIFVKGSKNVKIEIRVGVGDETTARAILEDIKKLL